MIWMSIHFSWKPSDRGCKSRPTRPLQKLSSTLPASSGIETLFRVGWGKQGAAVPGGKIILGRIQVASATEGGQWPGAVRGFRLNDQVNPKCPLTTA